MCPSHAQIEPTLNVSPESVCMSTQGEGISDREDYALYSAVTLIRTFFGSIWSARATCTSCVASQKPTATVK